MDAGSAGAWAAVPEPDFAPDWEVFAATRDLPSSGRTRTTTARTATSVNNVDPTKGNRNRISLLREREVVDTDFFPAESLAGYGRKSSPTRARDQHGPENSPRWHCRPLR